MRESSVNTDSKVGDRAIIRPGKPEHFMVLEPVPGVATAWIGETQIASSARALLVRETANAPLEPVVYFQPEDVRAEYLVPVDKTTSCPLKGTASYYDIAVEPRVERGAWQYQTTLSFDPRLARIECCVAFDRRFVTIKFSQDDLEE